MTKVEDSAPSRVSVLIPTYNGEQYLSEALERLFDQSGVPFDVWISDDASTDRTPAILDRFAGGICHVIHQPFRLGLARNHQFLQTCGVGKYITFLHQDDLLVPDSLRRRVDCLEANPVVSWVSCDVEGIDPQNRSTGIRRTRGIPTPEALSAMTASERALTRWRTLSVFLPSNPVIMPGVVLRREFSRDVGSFNPILDYTLDHEYWLRCLLRAPLGHISAPLVRYRWHGRQASATYSMSSTRANRQRLEALVSARREARRLKLRVPPPVRVKWLAFRILRRILARLPGERVEDLAPRDLFTRTVTIEDAPDGSKGSDSGAS